MKYDKRVTLTIFSKKQIHLHPVFFEKNESQSYLSSCLKSLWRKKRSKVLGGKPISLTFVL
jgi:hypothetical protein